MPALVDGELYAQQLDVPPWTLAEADGAALLSDLDWLLSKVLTDSTLPDDLIPHPVGDDMPTQPNDDDLIETLADDDLVEQLQPDPLPVELAGDDLVITLQEAP